MINMDSWHIYREQVKSGLPAFVSFKSYLSHKLMKIGFLEAATVSPSAGMCEIAHVTSEMILSHIVQ
jgi:hypothetical protein